MGISVSIVSTGNPKIDDYRVESWNPAIGNLGFCAHIGTFDSLVDTLSDESDAARGEAPLIDWDTNRNRRFQFSGGVLSLLQRRHNCDRYISTMTSSQRILRDEGILFGPGKVKDHIRQVPQQKFTAIIPPPNFGRTVETLLAKGITHTWNLEGKELMRSWSIPKFWELTSWPRDSDGASNVRFGFPVADNLDSMFDFNDDGDDDEDDDELSSDLTEATASSTNPFVTEISSIQDLSRTMMKQSDKDFLLFLSAKYCRTCKAMTPAFNRFARMNQSDQLLFLRGETTGSKGKELGKILQVNAVPSFVFFRRGQRFGTHVMVNKLPSKTLDMALELLRNGSPWDAAALEKLKEQDEKRRKN
jgi:thiol-disulfide isomerase/thioredoxin